jgi:4-amino-4-deoxy-L-arabinose transferase-like glycosyltransferase
MSKRLSIGLSFAVVVGCLIAIVSTYDRVSHTWDEPTHLATGMELLQDGSYTLWTESPPLARLPLAVGPYLDGARLPQEGRGKADLEATSGVVYFVGSGVLYGSGEYLHRLTLARLGTLPFFLLAAAVLWVWLAARPLAAFVAVTAFCTLPPILAHSGVATTDIGFAAVFLLFVCCLVRWLEEATPAHALVLGVSLGLAVGTKFTALIFVPPVALALVAARCWSEGGFSWAVWRRRATQIAMLLPVAGFVVWGAYGFSLGPLTDLPSRMGEWPIYGPEIGGLRGFLVNSVGGATIPAPELLHGISFLLWHNEYGHPAYALGNLSDTGFWYFYPVALLVKTPIPFMLLALAGLVAAFRRARATPWWVWGVFATIPLILLALLNSRVNIGSRHVLALYGLTALGTATTLVSTLESMKGKRLRVAGILLGGLLAWQVAVSAVVRPHFLTYFNLIAGDDPAAWLVDSDLDWGQGVFELEEFFREREADVLHVAYNGSAQLCAHDLPPLASVDPDKPVRGWVAVSELFYRNVAAEYWTGPPCNWAEWVPVDRPEYGWFPWLREHEPVAILDRSIRVYYVD